MSIKKMIKKRLLHTACNTVLSPKSFFVIPDGVREIHCRKEEWHFLTETSNNVCRIEIGGKRLFFRECKIHKEIHVYVEDEIDFYYTHLKSDRAEDRAFIKSKLSDRANFKKFVNMGMVNDKSSGAYRFCMDGCASCIGLDGMASDMTERVKDFVQFIWGDLFVYQLNGGLKIGGYQTYNALRSIATYRMARLLGLGDMIPKTEYAKLFIDGNFACFGTVMEEAPGFSAEEMDEKTSAALASPALQRFLNNLNVLDVLCLEKDHRPGNYYVTADAGKATGVCAFDNDSPNSFGIGGISFCTYVGCSPWSLRGRINRPYVDADTAERIMKMTADDVQRAFCDLLNTYQMMTLKGRLRKVQKILAEMPERRRIGKEAWSEDTMKEELSGDYGKTYLAKFLEKREMPYQPWIVRDGNG